MEKMQHLAVFHHQTLKFPFQMLLFDSIVPFSALTELHNLPGNSAAGQQSNFPAWTSAANVDKSLSWLLYRG